MTEFQMYDDVRAQMRGTSVTALEALANTLKKAQTEVTSISIIEFLASSNGLTCKMVALPKEIQLEDRKETIALPYIHIYKHIA